MMKHLIYFSLIFSLLVSCKSSGFLKQRYTHFGHSVAKHKTEAPASRVAKKAQQNVTTVAETESANQQVPSPAIELNQNQEIALTSVATPLATKHPGLKTRLAKKVIADLETFNLGSKKQIGYLKQTFEKENSNATAAAGVVGKALKIVMLLILLAIVVGLIILVSTVKQ